MIIASQKNLKLVIGVLSLILFLLTLKKLKEKNLTGYVFLPNVDGDIGYFIDKTNSDVYFFHPSGYLELVK